MIALVTHFHKRNCTLTKPGITSLVQKYAVSFIVDFVDLDIRGIEIPASLNNVLDILTWSEASGNETLKYSCERTLSPLLLGSMWAASQTEESERVTTQA
jgi:hypothetical protein